MDLIKNSASLGEPPLQIGQGYQRTLFPLDVIEIYKNDQGSADMQIIATAVNQKDYAVKTLADGNGHVPATELFCYELARELNIPTPEYHILRLRDATLAFGSAWEGGVVPIRFLPQMMAILSGDIEVRGLKGFLSRVYAFDLFINNIDRHFGNYLFRDSYRGMVAFAYDFGRSWYAYSPYTFDALDAEQNTAIYHKIIQKSGQFDRDLALATLGEIFRIERSRVSSILGSIPSEWLSEAARRELVEWWGSEGMAARINQLKASIK